MSVKKYKFRYPPAIQKAFERDSGFYQINEDHLHQTHEELFMRLYHLPKSVTVNAELRSSADDTWTASASTIHSFFSNQALNLGVTPLDRPDTPGVIAYPEVGERFIIHRMIGNGIQDRLGEVIEWDPLQRRATFSDIDLADPSVGGEFPCSWTIEVNPKEDGGCKIMIRYTCLTIPHPWALEGIVSIARSIFEWMDWFD